MSSPDTVFQRAYLSHPEFHRGIMDMRAAALGLATWGLMAGVAIAKSGLSTVESLFMALFLFAGSAQLASLPLLAAKAPLWVIWVTAFCVNLRFVVFSMHMRSFVMHLPRLDRMFVGHFTGDLTYVMVVKRFAHPAADAESRKGQIAYLMGGSLMNWLSWVVCNLLGVVLANFIPSQWGLGFAGTLALVGMVCSITNTRLRWVAAVAGSLVAVATFSLPLKLNILVAIAVAVGLSLSLENKAVFARQTEKEKS